MSGNQFTECVKHITYFGDSRSAIMLNGEWGKLFQQISGNAACEVGKSKSTVYSTLGKRSRKVCVEYPVQWKQNINATADAEVEALIHDKVAAPAKWLTADKSFFP
jgi:hypothetical protein